MNHKIIFFDVQTPSQKINKIIGAAHFHFKSTYKLLFLTMNEKVTEYIDELLWKEPKDSFLPHNMDENDVLVISHEKKILDSPIHYIFNLTDYPLDLSLPNRIVYEFDDNSNEEKKKIAKDKFQFYHKKKYQIQSR